MRFSYYQKEQFTQPYIVYKLNQKAPAQWLLVHLWFHIEIFWIYALVVNIKKKGVCIIIHSLYKAGFHAYTNMIVMPVAEWEGHAPPPFFLVNFYYFTINTDSLLCFSSNTNNSQLLLLPLHTTTTQQSPKGIYSTERTTSFVCVCVCVI